MAVMSPHPLLGRRLLGGGADLWALAKGPLQGPSLGRGALGRRQGAGSAVAARARPAEKLDRDMLQAFVTPVTKQLDLLAAARDPLAFDTIPPEAILRLLEVACDNYSWVVVDMPRHRRAWSVQALSGCDEVLVISELTVPALLAARSLSEEIHRR